MRDNIQIFLACEGVFYALYLMGYATFLFLSVTIGSATLYGTKRRRELKNELHNDYYLPISIIIPAYNESVTIEATIRSLLMLDYKLYEIVVVDDGSDDDTAKVVREAFGMAHMNRPVQRKILCRDAEAVYETLREKVPITLVQKKNGGKADALNMGVNVCQYPYVLCMDADCMLQRDSLEKVARPFLEDDNVIAVGGAVRPCNGTVLEDGWVKHYKMPNKLLAAMQVMEYDRSFLAARILLDKFNGSIIISGAFGLFRKTAVIDAGGYSPHTLGEDMELVVKLHEFYREHRIPYRIRYASDAICWTQAPEKLSDLCKQRRRWHIGLFQSMMDHRKILANPRFGMVGCISYIYFLIYELLSPYIEVFGVLTMVFASLVDFLNVTFMMFFMAIYIVFSAVMSLTAFFARIHTIDMKLSFMDAAKAIGLCALEVSALRAILAWVRMTALIGYKRKKTDWGKIERTEIHFDMTE